MELNSRKTSRQDSMMCLKSFDMQEMREMGWKEAEELISFPILWFGIMEDVFQMKGKEFRDHKGLKM